MRAEDERTFDGRSAAGGSRTHKPRRAIGFEPIAFSVSPPPRALFIVGGVGADPRFRLYHVRSMKRAILSAAAIPALAAAALLLSGCGGSATVQQEAKAAPPACPSAWLAGWQKLARQIKAPVYCPSWMPSPLDAQIGRASCRERVFRTV